MAVKEKSAGEIVGRHKQDFLIAAFFVLGVWCVLGIYSNSISVFGEFIDTVSGMAVGVLRYGLPAIFFLFGFLTIAMAVSRKNPKKSRSPEKSPIKNQGKNQGKNQSKGHNNKKRNKKSAKNATNAKNFTVTSMVGGFLILGSVLGMLHFTLGRPDFTQSPDEEFRAAGGILGAAAAIPIETLIGVTAASVILIALGIIGISIAARSTFVSILHLIYNSFVWLFAKRPPIPGAVPAPQASNGHILPGELNLPPEGPNTENGFAAAPGIEKVEGAPVRPIREARAESPSVSLTERFINWRRNKHTIVNTDADPLLSSSLSHEEPYKEPYEDPPQPIDAEEPSPEEPVLEAPNEVAASEPEPAPVTTPASAKTPAPAASLQNTQAPAQNTQNTQNGAKPRSKKWALPNLNLLNRSGKQQVKSKSSKDRGKIIEQALAAHGVVTRVIGEVVGPTVTRYELELGEGIKVAKLISLNKDIAYAMAAHDVRILAPIPGRQAIGIEVPNVDRQVITLGDVVSSKEAIASEHPLEVALGKDINGDTIILNVAETPHLLIAGATGAGKSSCLNSIVTSILMRSTPEQVRLILIDPKMVEMCQFEGAPHLLSPPVVDPKKAANALGWAAREMDRRYEVLFEAGYRDISGYNNAFMSGELKKKNEIRAENPKQEEFEHMPFIVVVVDELADLMMVAARDVEDYICRLAQKARAVGIHLVIATQRPSTDVITGVIKANVPARLAFSVSSLTDSRVILDQPGAERLVGQGDMLLRQPTSGVLARIQGAWITEQEVKRVSSFWSKQTTELKYVENLTEETVSKNGISGQMGDSGDDELLDMAMELVINSGFGSTSMLQRKLRVGFARAGRLMDLLEEKGIVGPSEGSKPREVLVAPESVND